MNKFDYRLMAVDIDGTLLRSDRTISEDTINTIGKLLENNKYFAIATGRPYTTAKPICDNIPYDIPLITANGALILMNKSNKIIYKHYMRKEAVKKVCELAKNYNATLAIWLEGKIYINKLNEHTMHYQDLLIPNVVDDFSIIYDEDVLKIIWFDEANALIQVQKDIKKYFNGEANYFTSQSTFLEFVDGNVSKADAIEILGNYLNVKIENTIAVGDGYNDLGMIKKAGLGIMMENAVDELKIQADYVTKTNNEDGVCYAIKKFML